MSKGLTGLATPDLTDSDEESVKQAPSRNPLTE
jgi:hypothetical protein